MIEKLRIRPYKKTDGQYLIQWLLEERMLRMWCREHFSYPLTVEQLDRYYEEMEQDPNTLGFSALDEAGTVVGSFRMSRINYEKDCVHLGFIVVDGTKRGQGIGERMVSMAVSYAIESLSMSRITLNVFEPNLSAKRCYEKVGFEPEQYTKEDFQFKDEIWGNYQMVYHLKEEQKRV